MDTQRIAELVRKIEAQDAVIAEKRTALETARAAVAEAEAALTGLKEELADELGDLLPRGRRKSKSTAAIAVPGRRQAGVSAAILDVFADGRPHSVSDVTQAITARGFTPKGVDMRLSFFSRQGKLRRVERGVYALA